MADLDNPYYLHPSDHPGLVLVSQPLSDDNYTSWKRAMTMALNGKNKFGFVDGTIVQPQPEDPLFRAWTRNNNIVASWLINSITKEITASVIYSNTAAEIWSDLESRFEQKNGPRVFQLKKDLVRCSQGSLSVSQYFTKVKTLWEELGEYRPVHQCHCGGVQPLIAHFQTEYVLTFLMGLNESFSHIRGQILLMRPLPSISDVFSLVIQDEKQRELGSSSQSTEGHFAGAVQHNNSGHGVKSGAQNGSSQASQQGTQQGYKSKSSKKDRPVCAHCGIVGHTRDKCFKLIGYPQGYFKNRYSNTPVVNQVSDMVDQSVAKSAAPAVEVPISKEQFQQMMTYIQSHMAQSSMADGNNSFPSVIGISSSVIGMSNSTLNSSFPPSTWVLDSGATSHISCSLSFFKTYNMLANKFVLLPNKLKVQVVAIGTVHLGSHFFLHDVLFIPSFNINLVSVSALLKTKKYTLQITDSGFEIQDKKLLRTIGKGELCHDLYKFQFSDSLYKSHTEFSSLYKSQLADSGSLCKSQARGIFDSVCTIVNPCNKYDQAWHARFGHLSDDILKILSKHVPFPLSPTFTSHTCAICPLSKFKRLPFVSHNNFSANAFDLIHCDIWGPFHVPTHDGKKYFLTIVDDATRFTWLHLLTSKGEATQLI